MQKEQSVVDEANSELEMGLLVCYILDPNFGPFVLGQFETAEGQR